MITQGRLKEVLNYDAETGLFARIKTKGRGNRPGANGFAGNLDKLGYVRIQIDKKKYMGHRLAWLFVYGVMPSMIDHANTNRSDNRISNLRETTISTNAMNRRKKDGCSSRFKGVSFNRKSKKWQANIKIDGKLKHLGLFSTEGLAHKAYCEAGDILFGEFFRSV